MLRHSAAWWWQLKSFQFFFPLWRSLRLVGIDTDASSHLKGKLEIYRFDFSRGLKPAYNAFLFCRGDLTLKTAIISITGMVLLSIFASTPMYYMAQIKQLVAFQEGAIYQDILICREMWPKERRVAYKTAACIVQFIIPIFVIVSVSLLSKNSV